MKLFGLNLFSYKKEPEMMYDFAQHGILGQYQKAQEMTIWATATGGTIGVKNDKQKKPEKVISLTAKGVFECRALNDNKFAIKIDAKYIETQIKDAEKKLELFPVEKRGRRNENYPVEVGGVHYGKKEVLSIIERLKNRKKINEFKNIIDKYPHTTSTLISKVVGANVDLRCNKADQFIPDLPNEAVKAMKEYNDMCVKLCNKKTHFYVIANREDFEVKNRRRDPILLAQSPFGFFWQILGAWDEEMIYLGDL